jgi:hypothetical protein
MRNMACVHRLIAVLGCAVVLSGSVSWATSAERLPFWTEKATYIEGDRLYAVGVSRLHASQPAARIESFETAKLEIQNFLQLSDLTKLAIHTQMQFETRVDGQWKSYRLVHVSHSRAMELKEKVTRGQTQALQEQSRHLKEQLGELRPVIEEYRTALEELKRLNREADEATHEIRERLRLARPAADALRSKIEARSLLTCLLTTGMSLADVRTLLGQPDSVLDNVRTIWLYGKSSVTFSGQRVRDVYIPFDCPDDLARSGILDQKRTDMPRNGLKSSAASVSPKLIPASI